MAVRRESARCIVNRKALSALADGFVEGMADMGRAVIGKTHPPDATPFGEGLVTTGDWGVWAQGKKVAGTASKPRSANVKTGVTLVAGYGFPGRFQELGTVRQPPRPFLTPSMLETIPGAAGYIKGPVRKALARVP